MENENKISSMAGSAHCTEEIMSACALCPRECLADRGAGKKGFCGMDERIYLARAALHMWEEPCISGTKGSGTVFFSGCGLRCCFCQNHDIAIGSRGRAVSVERLGEIFLELKEKGMPGELDQIEADIIERDNRDMNREISPLRQAEDAVLVDASFMGIEEVTAAVIAEFEKKKQA